MIKRYAIALMLCLLWTSPLWAQSNTILLPNAEQQYSDANGVPYAGGKVFFYVPGTSTPSTTYQDQGLTTPNTNPVVLDAAGRARIWGTGLFRQVLQDQFGNVIWDQITGTNLGSFSTISCTVGPCTAVNVVAGDNSTNIANTAFVTTAVANGIAAKVTPITTATVFTGAVCNTYVDANGGFFSLTLSASTNYPNNCFLTIINNDTNAGKTLIVNGLTNRMLWPLQAISYGNFQGAWRVVDDPGLWRMAGAQIFYIDPALGNDTNDCLALARPCQTIGQTFLRVIQQTMMDPTVGGSGAVTFQLADGTYAESPHIPGQLNGQQGFAEFLFIGDCTNPANVKMVGDGVQSYDFDVELNAIVALRGMTFTSSTNANAITANRGGRIQLTGCAGGTSSPVVIFGNVGTGSHIVATNGGYIEISTDFVTNGNAGNHIALSNGGRFVENPGVHEYYLANVTYGTANVNASILSSVVYDPSNSFNLGAFSVTGTRYLCNFNSAIQVNGSGGTFLPGSVGGTASTGCQYN